MDFGLFVHCHFNAGENQESPENIHDPTECIDQRDAREDKDRTRDQRQQNSPEQGLMFIRKRHVEKTEDQHEDKKIVDAQRVFNEISGRKLHRLGMAVEKVNSGTEKQSQSDPKSSPKQCFLHFDDVSLTIENTEIKSQHGEDKNTKDDPPQNHLNFSPLIKLPGVRPVRHFCARTK